MNHPHNVWEDVASLTGFPMGEGGCMYMHRFLYVFMHVEAGSPHWASSSIFTLLVFVCQCVHIHAITYTWRSEDSLGCWSLLPPCLTGSFAV